VFTAKYFCASSDAKYRVKAAEPYSLCSREPRKTVICNRQYADFVELVNTAARSPQAGLVAAFFLDEPGGYRVMRLEILITVRNFSRMVPSTQKIIRIPAMERLHATHVMRVLRQDVKDSGFTR